MDPRRAQKFPPPCRDVRITKDVLFVASLGNGRKKLTYRIDIREKDITYCCSLVPSVHRVNGFGQLRTAVFVDTTCIHPNVFKAISDGLVTGVLDLHKAQRISWLSKPKTLHIQKANLTVTPSVREDSVRSSLVAQKLLESQSVSIN